MLVRFASDRRTNQGGAKRNKRMQKPPKIELVFGTAHISLRKGCTYPYGDKNETNLSMKKGTLIRTETIRVHISVRRSYSLTSYQRIYNNLYLTNLESKYSDTLKIMILQKVLCDYLTDRISVPFIGSVGRYRKTMSQFSSRFLHASSFCERPTNQSGRSKT